MKKIIIGTLGMGLVIGAMSMTSFANERNVNVSDVDLNNTVNAESTFKVINQETTQYQKLDNNNNSNIPNQVNRNQYMNPANCCAYNYN